MSLPNQPSPEVAQALAKALQISGDKQVPLPSSEELKSLVQILQKHKEFGAAWALLLRARKEAPQSWMEEPWPLCTNEYAKQLGRGKCPLPSSGDLTSLMKALKRTLDFGLAGKALEQVPPEPWDSKQSVWFIQQLALCIYKDEELLPSVRFEKALALLNTIGLCNPDTVNPARIDPSTLPETLGLGGAIFKRKWEQDGQIEHLYQALIFYRSAWKRDPALDKGYAGVNAAYVLDILASREKIAALRSGVQDPGIHQWREEALKLRMEMKIQVPQFAEAAKKKTPPEDYTNQYWYLVTMAEIHFGLQEYKEAGEWLKKARKNQGDDLAAEWELQTTFRQLVMLARFQGVDLLDSHDRQGQEARQALEELLGDDTETALSCYRGRVGLALSGGGFRASLFHLGVLARLAETNVLPSVEVLSTVSGGSIVGAHYYLEVRNLLHTKSDKSIGTNEYIEIVERLIDRFLKGIELNLRTRVVSNLFTNLKMVFGSYSRSHRIGELYETHLYGNVADGPANGRYRMEDLLINPVGCNSFKPKFSNWRRRAKVPVVLLNSTSLNSGHTWHFTARWMGEAPGLVGQEVDVNPRYRRLWYNDAPTHELKNYRLGHAVAASACVPALFDPLVLKGLYPGRAVRLVDGSVHDNQGVGSLLNEGCTLLFCSDAAGQMADIPKPADAMLGVALRSNSILQSRLREAGYQDLKGRVESRSVQGLFFIHLKKGLEAAPLDWVHCQDPTRPPISTSATTDYGVDKELQRKLAAIRTDLDSFSEVEAYTLMASGYLMTEYQLKELNRQHQALKEPGTWGGFDIYAPRGNWKFLDLEGLVRQPPDSSDLRREDLGKQIGVGSQMAFKIWNLSPVLRSISMLLGVAILAWFAWFLVTHWTSCVRIGPFSASVSELAIAVVLAVAGILIPVSKWLRPGEAMQNAIAKFVLAFTGFIFANIHLWFFDRFFLRRGRLKRLLELNN